MKDEQRIPTIETFREEKPRPSLWVVPLADDAQRFRRVHPPAPGQRLEDYVGLYKKTLSR
jgi:hypothetical protein